MSSTQEKLQRAMMTGPNRWAEKTINGKLVSYYEIHDETILLDLINSAKREGYEQGYMECGMKWNGVAEEVLSSMKETRENIEQTTAELQQSEESE